MHTVGLVGLGNMGSGMAGNLLAAGYPLVVHDVRPDVVRGFVGLPDGTEYLVEEAPTAEALATRLLSAGAHELLRALTETPAPARVAERAA